MLSLKMWLRGEKLLVLASVHGLKSHPSQKHAGKRIDMAEDSQNTRPLSALETNAVETGWIRRIRRNMWVQGGCAFVCGTFAFGSEQKLFFIAVGAVLIFFCLNSARNQKLVNRDLSAGTVEEILGSVRMEERGIGDAIAAPFGAIAIMIAALVRFGFTRATVTRGKGAASVGVQVVLVRAQSTAIICVDRHTFGSLRDGQLVKATVLPISRVALSVKRAGLGDG